MSGLPGFARFRVVDRGRGRSRAADRDRPPPTPPVAWRAVLARGATAGGAEGTRGQAYILSFCI